jgi:hypothetical protein
VSVQRLVPIVSWRPAQRPSVASCAGALSDELHPAEGVLLHDQVAQTESEGGTNGSRTVPTYDDTRHRKRECAQRACNTARICNGLPDADRQTPNRTRHNPTTRTRSRPRLWPLTTATERGNPITGIIIPPSRLCATRRLYLRPLVSLYSGGSWSIEEGRRDAEFSQVG